jgi:hypothetical protein
MTQIHVSSGPLIQTLAAAESKDGALLILSTFGGADGRRDIAIHIPAAARAWLAGVARATGGAP